MAYNNSGSQGQNQRPQVTIQYSTIQRSSQSKPSSSGGAAGPAYHAQNLSLGIGSDSGSASPPRGKGKEVATDKEKDKDETKRSSINRVNRACNNCRRMKMRCVGAEDPPCKRCRTGNLECVMEKPSKGGGGGEIGDDRIRTLESQVTSIQSTLADLVTTLKSGAAANLGLAAAVPIAPSYQSPQPRGTFFAPSTSPNDHTPTSTTFNPYATIPGNTFPFPSAVGGGYVRPGGQTFAPSGSSPDVKSLWNGQSDQAAATLLGAMDRNANISRDGLMASPANRSVNDPNRPHPMGSAYSLTWQATNPAPASRALTNLSLPPSRAGSETPEEAINDSVINNPLGSMSSMAVIAEAAVERAREERDHDPATGSRKRQASEDSAHAKEAAKRFKQSFAEADAVGMSQEVTNEADANGDGKPKKKRRHVHAFPDVIFEGLVSEDEGRELMGIFYSGSSNFVPVFDPITDTWEELRRRSPFSVTSILMVGARVRDGGGPPSETQRICQEHARRIANGTMFTPVNRIEAVQAMVLLAAWNENGWLPGGHAVRMAIDMGVNDAFGKLLRSGMGANKTGADLEKERNLVVQARVWFCLYLIEHQMAYGMGRPAILREDEAIHNCRRLLEHPLSITSDARLVSTVELMALRAPLHISLTASPTLPVDQKTYELLQTANMEFDRWERYWDKVLSERFGKGRGDFFRESLAAQRQYAELFVNSQLLRGIKDVNVDNMPAEKRQLAIRAMRNAQACIDICLHGENYRNGLRYAVHYTHVCAAFAATFLIRIARIFPKELNLRKTAQDVEELAQLLASVPAGRYARSLVLILRRARKQKVIPAASARPSPVKGTVALPHRGPPTPAGQQEVPFSPSALVNPAYLGTGTPMDHATGSPSQNLLFNAGTIINDSPSSVELFDFDFSFAQETLERAGLSLDEGSQLPLFLNGESLGASNVANDNQMLGMEQFFLPREVDYRLGGTSAPSFEPSTDVAVPDPSVPGGDIWW